MSLLIPQLEMVELLDQSFRTAGHCGKVKYDYSQPILKLCALSYPANRFAFAHQTMHRKCYRFSFIAVNAVL